jgi:starch phosphorylase
MSLIDEGPEKKVRMSTLAIVGSHSVNGVAVMHTEILKHDVFRDFYETFPDRFSNKTNGVTPRRWLLHCNPLLSAAVTRRIGDGWTRDLDQLERLVPLADDPEFCAEVGRIKQANKRALAGYLDSALGIRFDPHSLLDMQIKRMHEYKRQLLNVMHVVALYLRLRKNPSESGIARTFLFGGKAAPGYQTAKLVIHLIDAVSETIASDPSVRGICAHFVPNYRVSLAERLIPACELSEQISTAGMEASGTGNMKLALNGALTIGTLDGANIEVRERVGADNFFLFGLTAEQVRKTRNDGYDPRSYYESNPELREVVDLIASGFFSFEDRTLFRPITDDLLDSDPFRVMADFASYLECQRRVEQAYLDQNAWNRAAVLNIARMGYFSSDRAIREYAADIWRAIPVPVSVPKYLVTDQA